VDYWFMPSTNSKISATGMIAKQQWEILKVDDTFEIRYDRSNPNLNIPMYGGSPSLVFSFFMFILGAVFILFGSLRLVSGFKKASYGKSN